MNWEMLGHEWAVRLLREQISRQSLRHAYLFVGPQGIGRRTLALRFAQALNCLTPPAPGDICGSCRACLKISRMQYADLQVVEAEEKGGALRVEQIRNLQRSLSLSAYEAKYKVAILMHFEDATISAMNALLKTLEEPAPQVVLILTAESAESLLPTIVSRCEVFRMRPLPVDVVSQGLVKHWGVPEEQAGLLAHISAGRPGYALCLYEDPELQEQRSTWLDDHWRLLSSNRVERFHYAETLANEKDDVPQILAVWLSFWRDVLLRGLGSAASLVNLDRQGEIDDLSANVGVEQAFKVVSMLEHALDSLGRNVNLCLAVEVVMLDLPYR